LDYAASLPHTPPTHRLDFILTCGNKGLTTSYHRPSFPFDAASKQKCRFFGRHHMTSLNQQRIIDFDIEKAFSFFLSILRPINTCSLSLPSATLPPLLVFHYQTNLVPFMEQRTKKISLTLPQTTRVLI